MKGRLKGAKKGHSLLKKKADALTLRFRNILKDIIEVNMWRYINVCAFVNKFLCLMPDHFTKVSIVIFQTKTVMGEIMREAQFSLAEANFAAGDFRCDVVFRCKVPDAICLYIYKAYCVVTFSNFLLVTEC
jgi:V-type H+-transporting ATPase subunit D